MEYILLDMYNNLEHQDVLSTYLSLNIPPTLISLTLLVSSIPALTPASVLSISVKRGSRRPEKYLIPRNSLTPLNICFVIDNLYYADLNVRLPLYTLLKQKEISKLLKKRVF